MSQEEFDKQTKLAFENGTAPCSLPTCLSSLCDECLGRAEDWADYLGITLDEVWDLSL